MKFFINLEEYISILISNVKNSRKSKKIWFCIIYWIWLQSYNFKRILMASCGSIIIKKLLESIKVPEFSLDPISIINSSGPYELTQTFLNHENSNSLILPSNFCYPYPSFLINSSVNKKVKYHLKHLRFIIEMSWMKGNLLNRVVKKLFIIYKFIKKRFIFK